MPMSTEHPSFRPSCGQPWQIQDWPGSQFSVENSVRQGAATCGMVKLLIFQLHEDRGFMGYIILTIIKTVVNWCKLGIWHDLTWFNHNDCAFVWFNQDISGHDGDIVRKDLDEIKIPTLGYGYQTVDRDLDSHDALIPIIKWPEPIGPWFDGTNGGCWRWRWLGEEPEVAPAGSAERNEGKAKAAPAGSAERNEGKAKAAPAGSAERKANDDSSYYYDDNDSDNAGANAEKEKKPAASVAKAGAGAIKPPAPGEPVNSPSKCGVVWSPV